MKHSPQKWRIKATSGVRECHEQYDLQWAICAGGRIIMIKGVAHESVISLFSGNYIVLSLYISYSVT